MKMSLAVGLLLAASGVALADPPAPAARCTLVVVDASDGPPSMDPKIPAALRSRLEHAPFTQWKNFKLTSEKQEEVKPGATATYPLPNNDKALVTYTEHKLSPAGKHVIRGIIDMTHPKVKTTFSLDEGAPFLHVDSHDKHGHIIRLSCKTEH